MSRLFNLSNPSPDLRKNVFDLSRRTMMTTSLGQIMPTGFVEVNPSEKLQFKIHSHLRTQELNTASAVRIKNYTQAFFVSYEELWAGFPNFIYGVKNRHSATNASANIPDKVPYVDVFKLIVAIITERVEKGERVHGYGGLRPITIDFEAEVSKSLLPNIRESFKMTSHQLSTIFGEDEQGYPLIFSISKFLETIGCTFSLPVSAGVSGTPRSVNLIDLLLYAYDTAFHKVGEPSVGHVLHRFKELLSAGTLNVALFRILAYQKIYSDFFRRDDYEKADPELFNVDDFYDGGDITTDLLRRRGVDKVVKMLTFRYRWLPKDFFTGVVPTELLTDATEDLFAGVELALSSAKNSVTVDISDTNKIDTRSLRMAYAFEKMLKSTRRARSVNYVDQTLAHFGYKPRGVDDHLVQFIGGSDVDVNISEVISTATTLDSSGSGSYLGEIGARGLGSGESGYIEFEVPSHGIVIFMNSVVADLDYNQSGLDPFLTKLDRGDYFHPEFQNLGMQPLFNQTYAYNPFYKTSKVIELFVKDDSGYVDVTDRVKERNAPNSIIGYQPRYSEYKVSYDRVCGILRAGRSLSAFTATNSIAVDNTGVKIETLRFRPSLLDSIFAINYNGTEETDQFVLTQVLEVKAIRPMSVDGQELI